MAIRFTIKYFDLLYKHQMYITKILINIHKMPVQKCLVNRHMNFIFSYPL